MKQEKPELLIIAGANGSGKTTFTKGLRSNSFNVIDPDTIAKKINPENPRNVDFIAGKKAVVLANDCIMKKQSFAIETTLSGKYHFNLIKKAKKEGFKISLIFIGTHNPSININRIFNRVRKGGHHVGDETVKRRYKRGLDKLGKTFDEVDEKVLIDNSEMKPRVFLFLGKKSFVSKNIPVWAKSALGKQRIKEAIVKNLRDIER